MRNKQEVLEALGKVLSSLREGNGAVSAIRGESGIGKSCMAEEYVDQVANSVFLIQIKGLPTVQSSLSSLYEALYRAISSHQVSKEAYVSLLRKYTRILPGFGQVLAPLLGDLRREALGEVIARSGIALAASPGPHIIKFIEELADSRRALIVCDDIQWLDQDSLEALVYLCSRARDLGWHLVLIYNDRVESWSDAHGRITSLLEYWENHSIEVGWTCFEAQRWTRENLSELCCEVLNGPCSFTDSQLSLLCSFTSGIPLYLKSALDVLAETKKIEFRQGAWRASGPWIELDIHSGLRKGILQRLKRIYIELPKSRLPLEVASVIGETFREEIVDSVLDSKDSYEVFCNIEERFKVIQYLFDQRFWAFDHNVMRESIYRSLGSNAARLHIAVAKYLEGSKFPDADQLTIAFHYEQGGDIHSAYKIKVQEVERLLKQALFESGLRLLESVISGAKTNKEQFDNFFFEKSNILLGRLLFHTSRYQEAMECFELLCRNSESKETRAFANWWMGKALIKLASAENFALGVECLLKAKNLYEDIPQNSPLGDICTDLVVAYAHMNRFEESEAAFTEAEKCFNRSNDRLGMARLQRRNVIFMDSELSAPIIEKVSHTFEELGVRHELVMSLNNAATEYIYIDNFCKAKELLKKAIEASLEIGGFHISYMYNNLAIIDIVTGCFAEARQKLSQAKEGRLRKVVEIVVENNEGVLQLETLGPEFAVKTFRRILEVANHTGERAYIVPITTNLAACLTLLGKYDEAVYLLEKVKPVKDNSYSSYKNNHWINQMTWLSEKAGNSDEISALVKKYGWCRSRYDNIYYSYHYALIDLQFWSD